MYNFEFIYDDETLTTAVEKQGETFRVTVGESTIELQPISENLFSTIIDGQRKVVAAVRSKDTCYIDIDSVLFELREPSDDIYGAGAGDAAGEKDKVFAPMPGKVVKLLVAVGDEVTEKQPMVIVEAMKMENTVLSKAKGTVKAVNFAAGDQVDTDTPIIELELEE